MTLPTLPTLPTVSWDEAAADMTAHPTNVHFYSYSASGLRDFEVGHGRAFFAHLGQTVRHAIEGNTRYLYVDAEGLTYDQLAEVTYAPVETILVTGVPRRATGTHSFAAAVAVWRDDPRAVWVTFARSAEDFAAAAGVTFDEALRRRFTQGFLPTDSREACLGSGARVLLIEGGNDAVMTAARAIPNAVMFGAPEPWCVEFPPANVRITLIQVQS